MPDSDLMDERRYSAPDTGYKATERNYDVPEADDEEQEEPEEEKKGLPLFVRKFLNRKK